MAIALCACQGNRSVGLLEESGDDFYHVKYDQFTGTKEQKLPLGSGQAGTISVSVVTDKGRLDIWLFNPDGVLIYEQENVSTSSFAVEAEIAGDYKLQYTAEKHQGSIDVLWS